MSDDDLYQAVSRAQDKIEELEARSTEASARRKSPDEVNRTRIAILTVIFAGLLVLYFFYSARLAQELQEDYRLAALDLIMEADADVYAFYQSNQSLPDQLTRTWLDSQVRYIKQGSTRYTLQLRFGPYREVIERDVRDVIYPSDVLDQLL